MSRLSTLSKGLRFVFANPFTTLRWAARCFDDGARREAARLADNSEWEERVAPYRITFERFLERYHLESSVPVRLVNSAPQPQSVRDFELFILGTLCRCLEAKRVMEIGTYRGRTTYNLAANVASGGRVFTLNYLDPESREKFVVGEIYRGTPLESMIDTISGDSMRFDFSHWYGSIDLMFIDGNHSLPYVRSDSAQAFRCVRPGGIIAWHDIGPNHPEATAAALGICEAERVSPSLVDGTQLLLVVRPGHV